MSTAPVRIAFIGLRGINNWHYLPGITQSTSAELVGGVDPAPEARAAFAQRSDAPLFANFPEMVAAVRPEAVVIGTPNPYHLTNVREALEAGLHVSVTKPLCNTVAECQEAIDLARHHGRLLQVGHEYRFRPSMRAALAKAASGELGDITMVVAHMGHQGGLGKLTAAGTWRSDPINVPGGCVNLLGVHMLDLANVVLGRPVALSASLRKLLAQAPLEDTAAITIEYENGGLAVVTSSYVSAPSDYLRIFGSEANLLATDTQLFLEKDRESIPVELDTTSSAVRVIDQLAAAIRHGAPLDTPGEVGLLTVAMNHAAVLSSQEEGRRIQLQ